jgi:hypothetical protein
MNTAPLLAARRLWAAALLVTALLLAADVLLARGAARPSQKPGCAYVALGPAVVRRRLRRLGRRPLLVLAPLAVALCDARLAPSPRTPPSGQQALALAVTVASIAAFAPVAYGPWGAGIFLAALVVLLRRIRGRHS